MSNPCYHQAAGGLNTAQMVLGCITISNKSGSIYKDEPASTFLVYTIPASKSQLDPIHRKATHTCNHQSWWILLLSGPYQK